MEKNSSLILMGQDIAEYGGVFKVTEGFAEKFGVERLLTLKKKDLKFCRLGEFN